MRYLHASIKMFIVGVVATLLAKLLGITNFLTAGVIGILSIHLTKIDSFSNGLKRYLDGLLAIALASISFFIIPSDYHYLAYGMLLFVFPALSFLFKIPEGIVPSIVLITHLLTISNMTFQFVLEEVTILSIAIGIAMLVNIFYPSFGLRKVDQILFDVDKLLKEYLFVCSLIVEDKKADHDIFIEHEKLLNHKISDSIAFVQNYYKDVLFEKKHVYLDYLLMRQEQKKHLRNIFEHAKRMGSFNEASLPIVTYMKELADDIGRENYATPQLKKLRKLFVYYRTKTELPKTRSEFETRAMLYQILYELQYFLRVKVIFHNKHHNFILESSL